MTDVSHLAPAEGRELVQMLPAEAYRSDEVLAWERRHLYVLPQSRRIRQMLRRRSSS